MNNKHIFRMTALLLILSVFFSCKKSDYIVGGSLQDTNQYSNMTTYEALQSMPAFDTLVMLIDAAGLKDSINQDNTTFFAPVNNAITQYIADRTHLIQYTISQDSSFSFDSLLYYIRNNLDGTRDSLLMYLVKTKLTYDALSSNGRIYPTALPGDSAAVSYEYTKSTDLGYNAIVSSSPRVVYFTQLWAHYEIDDNNTAADVPSDIGVHTLVQTSGINTKNGVIHALEYSHTLFFYGTKQ